MKLKHLIAAMALSIASALPAKATELKFASFTPAGHTITESVINKFVKDVADATNGELQVQVYLGGELGAGPVEQYVRVLQGVADIAWGLQGYTSTQFPRSMLVELPGMVPAGESGAKKIWAAYENHLASEFPGTKPLALWVSEPNVIIMRDKEIRTPEDLKGLKIRVAGAVAAEAVTALGAVPVQMPIFEVYNGLQTGLIDGVVTGGSAIDDFKLHEVANAFTVGAPLGRISFYVVMSQDAYDKLPDAEKAAVDNASGLDLSLAGEEAWQSHADDAVQKLRDNPDKTVIDLTPEQAKAFGDITLAITQKVVDGVDGGADTIAAMKAE